jgi:hypothetical protein
MQVVTSQITKLPKSKKKLALILGGILLLCGAYYILVYKPTHNLSPQSKALAEGQKGGERVFQQNLNAKRYDEYQAQLLQYEQEYIKLKDYKSAAMVLEEIRQNVPEDKLSQEALQRMVELAKIQHNQEDYEKYVKALIALSQKLGDKYYVDLYTKQLSETRQSQ